MQHKDLDAKLTIFIDGEGIRIEVEDALSGETIVSVSATPKAACEAMGRLAYRPAVASIGETDRFGKRLEVDKVEFKVPDGVKMFQVDRDSRDKLLTDAAQAAAPKGWTADGYFRSQDSVFRKDGETWARTHIRRWVKVDPQPQEAPRAGAE